MTESIVSYTTSAAAMTPEDAATSPLRPRFERVLNPMALLTLDEVAQMLRVSRDTVERRVSARELKAIRLSGLTRVRYEDYCDFVESMQPLTLRPHLGGNQKRSSNDRIPPPTSGAPEPVKPPKLDTLRG